MVIAVFLALLLVLLALPPQAERINTSTTNRDVRPILVLLANDTDKGVEDTGSLLALNVMYGNVYVRT